MTDAAYVIVEHDGGWAYKLGDVFSETFPTRSLAEAAASRVAAEQRVPGEDEAISWQDEAGKWHDELESGSSRPNAYVRALSTPQREVSRSATPLLRSGKGTLLQDVENNPLAAVLLAGACGYFLGLVLHRRG